MKKNKEDSKIDIPKEENEQENKDFIEKDLDKSQDKSKEKPKDKKEPKKKKQKNPVEEVDEVLKTSKENIDTGEIPDFMKISKKSKKENLPDYLKY